MTYEASEMFKAHPSLFSCYEYAKVKHKRQYRIGGKPYITHPVEVATILWEKGYSLNYLKTALFHDLLEDTNAAPEEIAILSDEQVLEAVRQLTKTKPVFMESYLALMGDIAKTVKLADRLHNLVSALTSPTAFRIRYIKETERYYLDFARGTDFEYEIKQALHNLKESIK